MFKSYIKIAVRSLFKNRLTTFINIFGLGLSMSVGLMILIRTQDAFSYDRFSQNPERIYRITSEYNKKTGERWQMASTPLPLLNSLNKNQTIAENVVNVYPALNGRTTGNGKEISLNGVFTEPSFFSMFGFSLLTGNIATALKEPNTIVISKLTAEKFFGNTNAVGKVIQFDNGTNFIITGILNTPPGKSHLNYDAYASYSSVPQMEAKKTLAERLDDWFAFNAGYTYVLLNKNAQSTALQSQLNMIANKLNKMNDDGVSAFHLQPFNQITPGSTYLNNDNAGGTSWSKIYIEAGIALLILFAACFNYTNLTIARALTRAKEVGIRKIVGAKRSQVFIQYIFESVLLSLLSLAFAWLILYFIVRYAPFNDGYEFIPSSFHYNTQFVIWTVIYALFTGLLAGTAPAWILSAFKPLRVLKNLSTAKILGKVSIQKTLIVFQYTLSLVVIIFLFVFFKQFSFISKADPGFKQDNIMVVPLDGMNENITAQQISKLSGVQSVSATSANFTQHFNGMNVPVWLNNKKDAFGLNYYYANADFITNMHFVFDAGNNFPANNQSEKEEYILLNEKAAHALGFTDAAKALGQKLWINDSTQLQITGVMKDFNYENAGVPVAPLAFRTKKETYNYLYVETDSDKKSIEKRIETILNAAHPSQPVTVSWLADILDKNNSQTATISLLGFLAFIALAIATLGLFGLVVYTVEVKNKEIGIRKIVGASSFQLVNILSKGFIKLLFIAGFIAMPIGWFLCVMFLQNFSIRVNFSFVNVLMCFLFLLGVGLFTIISQTYKAAIANPVESLRTE
ncbi:MAG TPA: ABC transporter permease [Parafilimonas sp.]|nr:ABC transporter permease [Parafilimonas sp.]